MQLFDARQMGKRMGFLTTAESAQSLLSRA
jgi:hypothetical protein